MTTNELKLTMDNVKNLNYDYHKEELSFRINVPLVNQSNSKNKVTNILVNTLSLFSTKEISVDICFNVKEVSRFHELEEQRKHREAMERLDLRLGGISRYTTPTYSLNPFFEFPFFGIKMLLGVDPIKTIELYLPETIEKAVQAELDKINCTASFSLNDYKELASQITKKAEEQELEEIKEHLKEIHRKPRKYKNKIHGVKFRNNPLSIKEVVKDFSYENGQINFIFSYPYFFGYHICNYNPQSGDRSTITKAEIEDEEFVDIKISFDLNQVAKNIQDKNIKEIIIKYLPSFLQQKVIEDRDRATKIIYDRVQKSREKYYKYNFTDRFFVVVNNKLSDFVEFTKNLTELLPK